MNFKTAHILRTLVLIAVLPLAILRTNNSFGQAPDTSRPTGSDTYPLSPHATGEETLTVNPKRNTFDLSDTSLSNARWNMIPRQSNITLLEKVGNQYYRTPVSFSMEEFLRLQGRQDEEDYFKKRADLLANMNRRLFKPKFKVSKDWFNRIVGSGKVEIKPSGYVELLAGYQGQNINNPTLPERARRNGGFDFNMNSQLQVDGTIGDKLKLPINYNTLANFEFENQLKLDYHGKDDEILKQFQAGNVFFSSKSTLIPGAQSLFGIKSQLQFGKLFISTVIANQRSQRQSDRITRR